MRSHTLTHAGLRLARWLNRPNVRRPASGRWSALGPLLAVADLRGASARCSGSGGGEMLRLVLLADFVYALVVAAFVARRVAEMIAARRRRSAGSTAAHAAGALLHRDRADPDDPRRGLRHDHAQLRARGLVLRPGAQRRGELARRGRRPTRRSTASRCRPTRACSATSSTSRRSATRCWSAASCATS